MILPTILTLLALLESDSSSNRMPPHDPYNNLDDHEFSSYLRRNWHPDKYDAEAIKGFEPFGMYYKDLVHRDKENGNFKSIENCQRRALNKYKYAYIRQFVTDKYIKKRKELEANNEEFRAFIEERDAAFKKASPMMEGHPTISKYVKAEYEKFGKEILVQIFLDNLEHPKVLQFIKAVYRGENVLSGLDYAYDFDNEMVDAAKIVIQKAKEAGNQIDDNNNDENNI